MDALNQIALLKAEECQPIQRATRSVGKNNRLLEIAKEKSIALKLFRLG